MDNLRYFVNMNIPDIKGYETVGTSGSVPYFKVPLGDLSRERIATISRKVVEKENGKNFACDACALINIEDLIHVYPLGKKIILEQ